MSTSPSSPSHAADAGLAASFPRPSAAVVVGASGGIGAALVRAIADGGMPVCGFSRGGAAANAMDITDEASIAAAAAALAEGPPLRLVLVASGLLHAPGLAPEKSLAALDPGRLARSFAVNAIGPALVAKHLLPLMPRDGRSVFAVLSARVGSIADNRLGGWYGYRASKAALNQLVRTAAIEQRRRAPAAIVVALHPGTVATGLSLPFRGEAERVFSPEEAAAHLLNVIAGLTAADSGGFFAWDGAAVPF